jgi:hypothetical protein
VKEFKQLLLAEDTVIARNLARQLVIFATGAPIHFGDRAAVEALLTQTRPKQYGVRSLVHAVVQSDVFRSK